MPFPLILGTVAVASLAITGVVKGLGAMSDYKRAQSIVESARKRSKNAITDLQNSHDMTNSEFEALGKVKLSIFKNQIHHLITVIKKSKHATSQLKGFDEIIGTDELKELEQLIISSLEIEKGLAAGAVTGALAVLGAYGSVGMLASASTGTAIAGLSGAAASNATLAWLGGGALSTGGFGIAGGTLVLGGIALGPALAVGGFMLSSKAEKELTQAYKDSADVDIAIAEMDQAKIVLTALQANVRELNAALSQMAKRFDAIKVNDDSNIQAFNQMMTVGKVIKSLLDIAIMEQDGSAAKNIKSTISGYL